MASFDSEKQKISCSLGFSTADERAAESEVSVDEKKDMESDEEQCQSMKIKSSVTD